MYHLRMGAEHRCQQCNNTFQRVRHGQVKYCSDECRELYQDNLYRMKRPAERPCRECNTVFNTSRSVVYCSEECRELNNRKRVKAYRLKTDPFFPRTDDDWEELNRRVSAQM